MFVGHYGVSYAVRPLDVWFGPTLPHGVSEANWAQTALGKGWNALFRLYGPLQPWFDKTWRVGEFELVN